MQVLNYIGAKDQEWQYGQRNKNDNVIINTNINEQIIAAITKKLFFRTNLSNIARVGKYIVRKPNIISKDSPNPL